MPKYLFSNDQRISELVERIRNYSAKGHSGVSSLK